ncbi:histidine kinase [Scytonema sp. HK-05]|uniref:sensor histidine kinase n=1 Tax=Scytonema sp. HK-05 TaxID=1137095 RepID=UPI000938002B|nr:HAMP domain-containing sensor histidine kinase [Scytonema sp. HK-05]OKH57978.1 histidine kinase [Scytonema sp. HK-05]BAY47471.1 histidine kinase [Scytonema sp. HK-05]
MYKWILPSLSEVLANSQSTVAECSSAKAEQQWRVSVAATEQLLLNILATASPEATQGLVLAAPAPVFSEPRLAQSLQTVTFTAKPFNPLALMPFQMPPGVAVADAFAPDESVLPLLTTDPLAKEQFCLVFTKQFRLVLVLSEDSNGDKTFSFSFDSEIVELAWRSLGARVRLSHPQLFADLEELVHQYSPGTPDYRIVMEFSRLLLTQFPQPQEDTGTRVHEEISSLPPNSTLSEPKASYSPTPEGTPKPLIPQRGVRSIGTPAPDGSRQPHFLGTPSSPSPHLSSPRPDVELLQAFAHEVRTPLTTIRTITRLLLKQRDLPANVIKRLEMIDRECTEQIDRMELLFRAAELETSPTVKCTHAQLTAMSLEQVLQQSIPRWQEAANRRNLTLDVVLPQQLPTVISNPTMLDRVLTGLMENFTRSLPGGSRIQVQVIPAGDQLKLQLLPLPEVGDNGRTSASTCTPPIRKALGQLLMFQPETGTISLNLAATKHLFQAIGGKLIVRERPRYGEVLTIFLPLEVSSQQKWEVKN